MPGACDSDFLFKVVRDLVRVSRLQAQRLENGHNCTLHNLERSCDAFEESNKQLDSALQTLNNDTTQFFVDCLPAKTTVVDIQKHLATLREAAF